MKNSGKIIQEGGAEHWQLVSRNVVNKFLYLIEEQTNTYMLTREIEPLNLEFWKQQIYSYEEESTWDFWIAILVRTSEVMEFLKDNKSSKLEKTKECLSAFYMGREHPYIDFKNPFLVVLYSLWIYAVTELDQFVIARDSGLWNVFRKAIWLAKKNKLIYLEEYKIFLGNVLVF
jgi:hypothetical protein